MATQQDPMTYQSSNPSLQQVLEKFRRWRWRRFFRQALGRQLFWRGGMLNKVMLIGNLGQDPEVRYTPAGRKVCKFSLATTKKFKQDGEAKEVTTWHHVVAWGSLADVCGQYLAKGRQVYIDGEIQQESWEKDGVKHYRTVINANTMKMLGRKPASDSPDNYSGGGPAAGGEDDLPF